MNALLKFRRARSAVALIAALLLDGCVTYQPLIVGPAPPYALLPPDELMSCEAMTASFMFAAKRAARIEFWMEVGPLPGYGNDMFGVDAPSELVAERQRFDALTDLQRMRGCPVMDPEPAVVYERQKLEEAARSKGPPLKVKG
ncbi:hypothetical protein [Bradyrhizobium sp. Tv2a-2]|uniref:hypothetical protein n=1 Tax=Bradyrhizobium sp. Tv2a-2 TaxID=113395 RepID=UPI0012EBA321|nr:hypothetical protein [Bradyrhizobium sp. Tv2a-2]